MQRKPAPDRDGDRVCRVSSEVFSGSACVDVPAYSDILGITPGAWGTTADDAVSTTSCNACCDPRNFANAQLRE